MTPPCLPDLIIDVCFQAPNTRHLVQVYLVSGTGYRIPGTWFSYLVPGTSYLVPGTWYQLPGTRNLVPGTGYQVTWHQLPGSRHGPRKLISLGGKLVPGTRYQVTRTSD